MNCISVKFLMIVAHSIKLDTKPIDFVLVFPQADLDVPIHMELTAFMDLEGSGKDSLKIS